MKVALELQPCCGKRSGIGTYTYELARRLQDGEGIAYVGNLFNFLHRNDNHAALCGVEMPIREQASMPYGVYRRIWHTVPLTYGMMFPKSDLNLFFNYIVPPRVSGKVMTFVHDMTYLRFPETMDARNLTRLRRGIQDSVKRSDRVVTLSEFSRQEIATLLHIPKGRIVVVPCAPSLTAGVAPLSTLSEKFHIHPPFLLHMGTVEPRKNLVRLIRAFARLKEMYQISHQLVLAGGKGWADSEIYQVAQEVPCAKEILFTGYISDEEKNLLYQQAEAFIFPSLYEGFGIPPLEAMALGCPVVCSHAASLPEVVGDAAELVDPLDECSIASGIWNVLSNRDYAVRLVEKGHAQAKRFTWDASVDRLQQICKEVLATA